MIKFSGPCFAEVDNRLMSLQLVQQGFTDAAMFTAHGEVVHPPMSFIRRRFWWSEELPAGDQYHTRLLNAPRAIRESPGSRAKNPWCLMEITLHNLLSEGAGATRIFSPGWTSCGTGKDGADLDYARYYKLVAYLARYTHKSIGIALGVPSLEGDF